MSLYLIAEIGINHNGDIEIAKRLIKEAKDAEFDAVKFQKRNPDVCVPEHQKNVMRDTPWGTMTYLEYKYRVEFEKEEYDEIDRYCIEKGISAQDFEMDGIRYILRKIKESLEPYINQNVKFCFFPWVEKFWLDVINEPEFEFFKTNLLDIEYENKIFNSISDLTKNGQRLSIHYDFCESHKKQCGDQHMNLEGHKIVANSIIKKFSK